MNTGPLAGYRVLVTRPTLQADALIAVIESAGGEVVRFPVMKITGRKPEQVATDFAASHSPDIAIFVSRNAVDHGLAAIRGSGALIAAVGPTTKAAIEAQNVVVDIVPPGGSDSEHLLRHSMLKDVDGKNITIVRGEGGRELLADTLRERGAKVTYLPVYRRQINNISAEEIARLDQAWREGGIDCVTVLSVETLEYLLQLLPPTAIERLRQTPLVAPSERVIQTALERLPGIPAVVASGPRAADMLNALMDLRHSGRK